MAHVGSVYTSATWLVRAGNEEDFVLAWESFAQWCMKHGWGVEPPLLLRNLADRRYFVSFGQWEDRERAEEWRRLPEFQDFLARARELCEEVRPGTFHVAAHPTP